MCDAQFSCVHYFLNACFPCNNNKKKYIKFACISFDSEYQWLEILQKTQK